MKKRKKIKYIVPDHAHGIGMSSVESPLKTLMEIMDSGNAEFCEKVLSPESFEKLDIKKLSKYHNKELTEYSLNLVEFIANENKR